MTSAPHLYFATVDAPSQGTTRLSGRFVVVLAETPEEAAAKMKATVSQSGAQITAPMRMPGDVGLLAMSIHGPLTPIEVARQARAIDAQNTDKLMRLSYGRTVRGIIFHDGVVSLHLVDACGERSEIVFSGLGGVDVAAKPDGRDAP